MREPIEGALFEAIYASVVRREATYDGVYYTGVRTTKIVCRPSCRAKTPLAANVTFYRSLAEALEAGFRPCKRCRPEANGRLSPDAALAAQVDGLLEAAVAGRPTLASLAKALSISPFHLQRIYKRERGESPAAALERLRRRAAVRLLEETEAPIGEVARAVGYGSASHFAAWFARGAGASPTQYRSERRERSMQR